MTGCSGFYGNVCRHYSKLFAPADSALHPGKLQKDLNTEITEKDQHGGHGGIHCLNGVGPPHERFLRDLFDFLRDLRVKVFSA
jgi:hypothetical protein